MQVTFEIDVPAGYEATGEYRYVTYGEFFLANDAVKAMQAGAMHYGGPVKRIILKKIWQPPEWLPDGNWIYSAHKDGWYVTPCQPTLICGDGYYSAPQGVMSVSLEALHKIFGGTMNPPPFNKIQVKHAAS